MKITERHHGHPRTTIFRSRFEAPTWAVTLAVYGGWGLLTWHHGIVPPWLLLPFGAMLIAWHGSLQHETIHGHPTRRRWLNAALGWPPLGLWLPYPIYRESHLRHHNNRRLTEPGADPESFYLTAAAWAGLSPILRALHRANRTLLGRLTLGPALLVGTFASVEARRLWRGDSGRRGIWLRHALGAAAVLGWVGPVCGMPVWLYLLGVCYPGLSLTLLRSFAEHRAAADPAERTAVVHAGPLLSLLFLNNNLHVAHHARPGLSWYRLPAFNRRIGGDRQAASGAGFYPGYGAVLRRYLLRPVDHPVSLAATAAVDDAG